MPLQSSGEISIADVITFTRASASVVDSFPLGPVSTQRSLSFYYNQAFVIPSTFDVTANANADDFVLTTTTINTNGATLFGSVGKIFSLRLNNSSGYGTGDEGTFNQFKLHQYDITNIPAGTYKVGARYSVNQISPNGGTVSYALVRPQQPGGSTNIDGDTAISTSSTATTKDLLSTFTLNNTLTNTIRINHTTSNNVVEPTGIVSSIIYVNILRVA
jgi:hypothetical protein